MTPICKNCKKNHFNVPKIISTPRCQICGKELISNFNICSQCKSQRLLIHTDKVIPMFSYRLWNKELLFQWKINNVRSLSLIFSDFYAQVLRAEGIQIIVPVPPRPGKIRKNGWDQIDEVTKILKYKYGFMILPLLKRNSSQQQKKLNRNGRLDSINQAYSLLNKKELHRNLRDLKKDEIKICLIDDVCTTGSTLECCAKLLKKFGIKIVEAVVLFTVD